MNPEPTQFDVEPDVEPVLDLPPVPALESEPTPVFQSAFESASEPQPEPAPAPEPEPDKSDLVNEVMARLGTPSWEAWAMTVPELTKKLES